MHCFRPGRYQGVAGNRIACPGGICGGGRRCQLIDDGCGYYEGIAISGRKPEDLAFENGRVFVKANGPANGVPFADLLRGANLRLVTGNGIA
jgi:hypothetical protein